MNKSFLKINNMHRGPVPPYDQDTGDGCGESGRATWPSHLIWTWMSAASYSRELDNGVPYVSYRFHKRARPARAS